MPVPLSSQPRNPPAPSQLRIRGDCHTAPEATASPLPPQPAQRPGAGQIPTEPGQRGRSISAPQPEATVPLAGAGRCSRGRSAAPAPGDVPQHRGESPGRGRRAGRQGAAPRGQWRMGKKPNLYRQDAPLFHALKSPEIATGKEIAVVLEACH